MKELRSNSVDPGGHVRPGFYSEWEAALKGVEQRMDEVGLKGVNSNSGYYVDSRL